VGASPNHMPANVLAAATRLLLLPQQPAGSNFLNSLGISAAGRDLYNWTAHFNKDANGKTLLPPNLTTAKGLALYNSTICPAISNSLANLARVTDTNFLLELTADETGVQPVTLDYGDVLLLRALLHTVDFAGHTLKAHDFNVVFNQIKSLGDADLLTIQRLLATYTNLLTQVSRPELLASKEAFTNAILRYLDASEFIRKSRPAGADRLFVLEPGKEDKEASFRQGVTMALASVDKPVIPNPDDLDQASVYAGAYFAGTRSLRSLLPRFAGNNYVPNSLPDYTFGGMLLNEASCDVESTLRKMFNKPYPGIYEGQLYGQIPNGLGGYNYGVVGGFVLIVRTNMVGTLLAHGSEPIFTTVTVDRHGDWFFGLPGAGITGHGNLHDDGSLEGQVFGGGWSNDVRGWRRDNQGPFQTAAGFYQGNWTKGRDTGRVFAILDSAGGLFYCPFNSSGPFDGGYGYLNSSNAFSSTSFQGMLVSGQLDRATLHVNGNITDDGGTGTFLMGRTDFVPSDVLPALRVLPQDQKIGRAHV
jgi:hypothetical protein